MVKEQRSDNVFVIEFPSGLRAHNAVNIWNLKIAKPRPDDIRKDQNPIPMDEHGICEILKITGERKSGRVREYKVWWAGSWPPEASWVRKGDLRNAKKAVRAYRKGKQRGGDP